MRRFGIELLREAASPALRATASLAHAYQPLARELFSAAFVCCWEELDGQYRDNLVHALKTAFVADVSPEILQTLLNLVSETDRRIKYRLCDNTYSLSANHDRVFAG
jgi:FKBP12-rapamycin complex-associated protein